MLTQPDYQNLWTGALAQPLFNLPCYYQYLQREVYFQDYLDLFGTVAGPTFPRFALAGPAVGQDAPLLPVGQDAPLLPVGQDAPLLPIHPNEYFVALPVHIGLPPDPAGIFTVIVNGIVYLKVEYNFPFYGFLNQGRTIQRVLIGEAAPAPGATRVNAIGQQLDNTYFYNILHIGPTPYFSQPLAAFGIPRTNKTDELVALANHGFILPDLLPFAVTYPTPLRRRLKYFPFWDLLCDKICGFSAAGKLHPDGPDGVNFGFAGPPALHHRIVADLIAGVIALPACPGHPIPFAANLHLNELHTVAGVAIPHHHVGHYLTNWRGLVDPAYHVNGNAAWVISPNAINQINLPIYACECWDAAFTGPNSLFIRVAFNLP